MVYQRGGLKEQHNMYKNSSKACTNKRKLQSLTVFTSYNLLVKKVLEATSERYRYMYTTKTVKQIQTLYTQHQFQALFYTHKHEFSGLRRRYCAVCYMYV